MGYEHAPFGNCSQNPVTQIVFALGNGQCTGVFMYRGERGGYAERIAKSNGPVRFCGLRGQQKYSHTVVFAAKTGYGIPGRVQYSSADFGEAVRGSGKNVRLYRVPFPSFSRVSA